MQQTQPNQSQPYSFTDDRTLLSGSAEQGCAPPSPSQLGGSESAGVAVSPPVAAAPAASADAFQPLWDRGVSREVAEARGYVGYGRENRQRQPVRDAFADYAPHQRSFMTRMAGQADGLVIPKHVPAKLSDLPPIPPQLRPEEHVRTTPFEYWHFHPTVRPAVTPLHPVTGVPMWILNPRKLGAHIDASKERDDHNGVNCEMPHRHPSKELAKYVFLPAPRITYEHDHDVEYGDSPEQRHNHVTTAHGGVDVHGLHEHTGKSTRAAQEKRIDVNPSAEDLFEGASRVYFSFEGSIKGDAILSAIRREKRKGESVFNVPAVGLSPRRELERFVREYGLGDALIVIVPDGDWATNPNVLAQALYCRTYLRRKCGVDACIAASPQAAVKRGAKGIDDFLQAKGDLDDLEVLVREAPLDLHGEDAGVLCERVEALALHAPDGVIAEPSLRKVAKILGVHHENVEARLQELIDLGYVESDRPIRVGVAGWQGKPFGPRSYYNAGLDWQGKRPTLTIREDLRASKQLVRLRDYAPPALPPSRAGRRVALLGEALIGPWRPLHEQLADAKRTLAAEKGLAASTSSREPLIRLVTDYLTAYRDVNMGKLGGAEAGPLYGMSERGARKALAGGHDIEGILARIRELSEHDRRLVDRAINNALVERRLPPGQVAADIKAFVEGATQMTAIQAEEIIVRLDRIEQRMEEIGRENPHDGQFLREIDVFLQGVAQARRLDEAA